MANHKEDEKNERIIHNLLKLADNRQCINCSSYVLANLIVVSTIDPGIIPRDERHTAKEVGTGKNPRLTAINVNGVEVKLKSCRICKIYRPPRSCHCAIRDNCVERFDHHCPRIGHCIGLVCIGYAFFQALNL